MKNLELCFISDTHGMQNVLNKHFKDRGGDILFHCGDGMTSGKNREELIELNDFLGSLDFSHVVIIPGNHDWMYEWNFEECKKLMSNCTVLNDSGIEIDGLKIWGSPITPWFHSWAFNRFRGKEIKKHWDMIPGDTDILITHGPPYGILDEVLIGMNKNQGCHELLERVQEIKPIIHGFGHIHEGRECEEGVVDGVFEQNGIKYINASVLGFSYTHDFDPVWVKI